MRKRFNFLIPVFICMIFCFFERTCLAETYNFNGHTYQVINEGFLTWQAAEVKCEELGGHLATITSQAEYDFILSLVPPVTDVNFPSYWLGATRSNGKWAWITGEDFLFTAWHPSYPDSDGDYLMLVKALYDVYELYGHWGWANVTTNSVENTYSTDGEVIGGYIICEWDYNKSNLEDNSQIYTFQGHRYQVFHEGISWTEAQAKSEKLGGHLATITSQAEYDFILSFLTDDVRLYWLGATDANEEGVWKWVTGEPFSFTKWLPGEPNNLGNENYLILTNYYYNQWGWDDGTIDAVTPEMYSFICEWDESENGDITSGDITSVVALERGLDCVPVISEIGANVYIHNDTTAQQAQNINEEFISKLTIENNQKIGLTADGNTRLFLRVRTSSKGTVTFSLPKELTNVGAYLEDLNMNRSAPITGIPTTAISTTGKSIYQATAVLVAPKSWPTGKNLPKYTFEVEVAFNDGTTSHPSNITLELYKTPVMFIHGIYGKGEGTFGLEDNNGIWKAINDAYLLDDNCESMIAAEAGAEAMLYSKNVNALSYLIGFANYTSTRGPSDEITGKKDSVILQQVLAKIKEVNAKKIACSRVDFVCHSMGGLMARRFLDVESKNSEASYKQHIVRRIITVATPQEGSPMTSYLLNGGNDLPYIKAANYDNEDDEHKFAIDILTSRNVLNAVRNTINRRMGGGDVAISAWIDLALESKLVQDLRTKKSPRPIHIIYGTIRDDLKGLYDKIIAPAKPIVLGTEDVVEGMNEILPNSIYSMKIDDLVELFNAAPGLLDSYERLYALLDVMFNKDDYDIAVSQTSAKSIFGVPGPTMTKYDSTSGGGWFDLRFGHGGYEYNHLNICHQDDVAQKVLALLTGDESNFDVSGVDTVSTTSFVNTTSKNNLRSNFFAADDSDYFKQYFTLQIGTTTAPSTVRVRQPEEVKLTITAPEAVNHNVYMILNDETGGRIFRLSSTDEKTFEATISFDETVSGVYDAHCFSQADEGVYISDTLTFVVMPDLTDNVAAIGWIGNSGTIFTSVSADVDAGLYVLTSNDKHLYNISSPLMGTTWKSNNPEIAFVTDAGKVCGLKEGRTILTATYENLSASISVDVSPSYESIMNDDDTPPNSEDIDTDIDTDNQTNTNNGGGIVSSGGGCNAGFGVLIAVAVLLCVAQKIK